MSDVIVLSNGVPFFIQRSLDWERDCTCLLKTSSAPALFTGQKVALLHGKVGAEDSFGCWNALETGLLHAVSSQIGQPDQLAPVTWVDRQDAAMQQTSAEACSGSEDPTPETK